MCIKLHFSNYIFSLLYEDLDRLNTCELVANFLGVCVSIARADPSPYLGPAKASGQQLQPKLASARADSAPILPRLDVFLYCSAYYTVFM